MGTALIVAIITVAVIVGIVLKVKKNRRELEAQKREKDYLDEYIERWGNPYCEA